VAFLKLRCPRNGTADEENHCVQASALVHTPLEISRLWEGRKGRSASPDTGQQAARDESTRHMARARGEAGTGA